MESNYENRPKKTGQGFLSIDGESIYFESYGEGPAIVLGHGLGGNHASWFQQVPYLAQYFRVITFDQRGFGKSTNKSLKHSPSAAAEDMKAILDYLGVEKAHLVGQSLGGWCMLDFSFKYPERVLSIVLSNSIAGIFSSEHPYMYDTPAPRPPLSELPLGKHFGLADDFYDRHPELAFLYVQISSLGPNPPSDMRVMIREIHHNPADVIKLNKPILFISGSKDITFPPEWIKQLHKDVCGSELKIFEGAAHSPYFEMADEYNDYLKSFIDKV